jgi:hypothetical protein
MEHLLSWSLCCKGLRVRGIIPIFAAEANSGEQQDTKDNYDGKNRWAQRHPVSSAIDLGEMLLSDHFRGAAA